jgi:ectoine hydroxylase-related dioxygenase (phytanoyl-CoA dioxygenase family)
MDSQNLQLKRRQRVWLTAESGDFATFDALTARSTAAADWPLAASVERNVLIYDGDVVRVAARESSTRQELMAEWVEAFESGPGVIVISGAYADTAPIDRASEIFEALIEEQRRSNTGAGDHFAKPGANDRIWNSLEKHCLADPANFAAYYGNLVIGMASEAWLGAGYQITAQVNRVNPGGEAQSGHRDYHLGFMSPEQMARYPAHVHRLSPVLTLQGAIAHGETPLESGPTLFLPYSQNYFEGYLSFTRPEVQALFNDRHVQLPLKKGDAMFFNPAMMHAAGANRSTGIYRMANLLQVSSAFGRAMESVDRTRMMATLYPALLAARSSGTLSAAEIDCAIAASAEGYSFPTNLDRDPPVGGLAPRTQAQLTREALAAELTLADFETALRQHAERRCA